MRRPDVVIRADHLDGCANTGVVRQVDGSLDDAQAGDGTELAIRSLESPTDLESERSGDTVEVHVVDSAPS